MIGKYKHIIINWQSLQQLTSSENQAADLGSDSSVSPFRNQLEVAGDDLH